MKEKQPMPIKNTGSQMIKATNQEKGKSTGAKVLKGKDLSRK